MRVRELTDKQTKVPDRQTEGQTNLIHEHLSTMFLNVKNMKKK